MQVSLHVRRNRKYFQLWTRKGERNIKKYGCRVYFAKLYPTIEIIHYLPSAKPEVITSRLVAYGEIPRPVSTFRGLPLQFR